MPQIVLEQVPFFPPLRASTMGLQLETSLGSISLHFVGLFVKPVFIRENNIKEELKNVSSQTNIRDVHFILALHFPHIPPQLEFENLQ